MRRSETFWRLIQDNRIVVPVIQREYAQGREDDRVKTIRQKFVKDLIVSLTDKQDVPLHLGFVYGKIDGKEKVEERQRNKRAIENILNAVEGYAKQLDMGIITKIESLSNERNDDVNLPIFIPLDGQQRLTTLFLLHWYLAVHSANSDLKNHLKTLRRFTYKTRKSSMEFTNAICDFENVEDIKSRKSSVSENIKNKVWFRHIWLKDATVRGMLVMLDELDSQLSSAEEKERLLERLIDIENPSIAFDFLDLDKLNQTDELYVKMNARGKQLSEFEHFKAWLQNYVFKNEYSDNIKEKDWKRKLDKEWLDVFWKNKSPSIFYVDDIMYHAFKQITLYHYIATEGKKVDEEFTRIVRESAYIPFSLFEEKDFFNIETLNFLFSSLNAVSNRELIAKYENWLQEITGEVFFGEDLHLTKFYLNNDQAIDRPESVFYYVLLLFLNYSQEKDSEDKFKKWMRFTRNIIFNTYIQNPSNYIDAVIALYSLREHIDTIDNYLLEEGGSVSFFGDTVKQELIKFNLKRDTDNDWEIKINETENHKYFKGDIGFILKLSLEDNVYNYKNFVSFSNCAREVFGEKIRSHEESILQRSLLTFGDYLPSVRVNHLIPLSNGDSLRARRDNWQKVFNSENGLNILKNFFIAIENSLGDLKTYLNAIISDYSTKDWKWYFISSRHAIDFCKKGFIRYNSEDEIYLLRTTRIYGSHAELRSYVNYCTQEVQAMDPKPFKKIFFWENPMSRHTFSCIIFEGWKYRDHLYNLELTYTTKKEFLMQLVSKENTIINSDIIEKLSLHEWQIDNSEKKVYLTFNDETEIKTRLSDTLQTLSKVR
ncbi:DUF262 domain-containing protein [Winogradskyella algicola]|uniref:DUF262 domain-containing protein n=1 Tax=Winogradskyella algicola TaxID=2575815 RepID=UPI001108A705|nr:DUF262 domain-containing protein [Winogradskyella algicola]